MRRSGPRQAGPQREAARLAGNDSGAPFRSPPVREVSGLPLLVGGRSVGSLEWGGGTGLEPDGRQGDNHHAEASPRQRGAFVSWEPLPLNREQLRSQFEALHRRAASSAASVASGIGATYSTLTGGTPHF